MNSKRVDINYILLLSRSEPKTQRENAPANGTAPIEMRQNNNAPKTEVTPPVPVQEAEIDPVSFHAVEEPQDESQKDLECPQQTSTAEAHV